MVFRIISCLGFLFFISALAISQSNGVCEFGEAASHPDCDGVCDSFDSPNSVDCDGVCGSNESSSSPDCNGICDPSDHPSSPDCIFSCNPSNISLSSNLLCNNAVSGTTVGAPTSTGDFCGTSSAEAVFYRFDATTSDVHTVQLSNNATNHIVSVYENCSVIQSLSCASTEINISLMQGKSYIIAIFPEISGSTSSFDLCIYIPEDYSIGNVGVNTIDPKTRLDVHGGVRPGFTSNEIEGNIRWSNDLEVFDGNEWTSLTKWNYNATDDIVMNANRIINLASPINGTDAATKDYVDASTDNDADPSNEIQVLSKTGNTVTLSLNGGNFIDEVDDADNDPANEIETWNTLSGIPADIADGDDVDDADNDPSNELQSISKVGNTVTLSLGGGNFTDAVDDADNDPTNEIETWNTLSGIPADIADGDDVNDADNDPTNEIETWSTLTGIPADIADGDNVNDADNDPSNELQIISKVGNTISLSSNGGSVSIDDGDSDDNNEVITSAKLIGNTLEIIEAGLTNQVDLSSIATQWQNNGNEIYYTGANIGLGISNPDQLLDVRGTTQIRMNSSGSTPQLQLVENSGSDGARINFQSSVETNNLWTLFARADDTLEDNTFNLFHTVAGNIIRIQADGDIGFHGVPNVDLHVFHSDNINENGFKLQNNGTGGNWWRLFTSSSDGNLRLFSKAQGTNVIGVFDENTGVYSSISDSRYKDNIVPNVFDWNIFMSLQPYSYNFKNSSSKKKSIGLLAQEVKDAYPELVTYLDDKDQYLLDYNGLSVIALQAIQEQQNAIITQGEAIKRLESENDDLRNELSEIKEMLKKITKK